jgi:hypothetical protein
MIGQDSCDRPTETGQPLQGSHDKTAGTGHRGKDSQTGQSGQVGQTDQPGKDREDRMTIT